MSKTNTFPYVVAIVVIGIAALSFNYFRGPKSMVIAEMDSDASVLDQLKKAGSNLKKPHRPEFFLYLPTKNDALHVANILSEKGFVTEVKPSAGDTNWLCRAEKTMILRHEDLLKIRNELNQLVQPLRGKYDGWGTEIVK
jgi:hypothetical protein